MIHAMILYVVPYELATCWLPWRIGNGSNKMDSGEKAISWSFLHDDMVFSSIVHLNIYEQKLLKGEQEDAGDRFPCRAEIGWLLSGMSYVCTIRQRWFFCSLMSPDNFDATTIVIIEFPRSDVNDSFGTKRAPIESYSIIEFLRGNLNGEKICCVTEKNYSWRPYRRGSGRNTTYWPYGRIRLQCLKG